MLTISTMKKREKITPAPFKGLWVNMNVHLQVYKFHFYSEWKDCRRGKNGIGNSKKLGNPRRRNISKKRAATEN